MAASLGVGDSNEEWILLSGNLEQIWSDYNPGTAWLVLQAAARSDEHRARQSVSQTNTEPGSQSVTQTNKEPGSQSAREPMG